MSGVPCDLLVDIDGPQDCFVNSSSTFKNSDYSSGYDDDPFELCSMLMKKSEKNLDIELGLALEKSIRLCSQTNYQSSPVTGAVKSSNHLDLGILVNLDESPDKKLVDDVPTKDPDTVFTHTPSNPFELAWDVIEQEALTLANHIQDDEEKPISPRKMVDLAMHLSPDSMLLSPRNDLRDKGLLISSSPECEAQTVPKSVRTSQFRGRSSSVASSPVVTKSIVTPSRSRRPSVGGASPLSKSTKKKLLMPSPSYPTIAGASPLSKSTKKLALPLPLVPTIGASPSSKSNHKTVLPSPANPAAQKPTFRTPLFRSSSTTIPSHHVSSFKPTTKAVPMKAVHHGPTVLPSSSAKPPVGRSITETPVRRSITPLMTPKPASTAAPSSTPAFLSKLRAPLTRTESEIPQPTSTKIPNFQRQGSLRYGSKRTSLNTLPNGTSANLSRFGIPSRLKPKGRENTEP